MAGTHRDRPHKNDNHDPVTGSTEYPRNDRREQRDRQMRRDGRNSQRKPIPRNDKSREDWGQSDGHYFDHEKRGMEYSAQRLKDPAAHLLFRTKLCKFFSLGACTRGPQCAFAHDYSVLRHTPNLSKTSLCPQLMKYGSCDKGKVCNYAHSKAELRSASDNEPLTRSEEHTTTSPLSSTNRLDEEQIPSDFPVRNANFEALRCSKHLDVEIMKVQTKSGQVEQPSCVPVRSPLRAPFSSPVRVPEMVLSSPHFCPTSPPWRPLSPSFDDSASIEGRPRFDSHGCVVVKNTFLEFVADEENMSEKEMPLRRVSTWCYNISEPDEERNMVSFDSTTVSSDQTENEWAEQPQSSTPELGDTDHGSGRLLSSSRVVLTGFDD